MFLAASHLDLRQERRNVINFILLQLTSRTKSVRSLNGSCAYMNRQVAKLFAQLLRHVHVRMRENFVRPLVKELSIFWEWRAVDPKSGNVWGRLAWTGNQLCS
jgi:hypothetical protein